MSAPAEAAPSEKSQTTTSDAFARLTPFGWTGGLAAIFAGLALSFFLVGYFVIYWRNADMDFMVVYNALAMNDGKPQIFFDHPAYFTILSVKVWFQFLHSLGLLDAWRLSAIPSATDVPAFDAAMTSAIRAGRVVAFLTGGLFVAIYASLIRYVIRDRRVALLTVFAFAYSGGVAVQIRILRSEMIAGGLFAIAFLVLLIVGRDARVWRPLAMAAAAALCVLGLENKVQTILLIATLPLLMLPFGTQQSASVAFWRNSARAWSAAIAAGAVAAALFIFALPIIKAGLTPEIFETAHLRPLLGGPFRAQACLLAWIVIGIVAYAAIWRVSLCETLATIFAVIAGASLALLALNLNYNAGNVAAVINPVEKMLPFAASGADAGSFNTALGNLLSGIVGVLKRYTFVLYSSPRPTVFLVWFVVPAIVVAWRRGERQAALQALFLTGAAFSIDVAGVQRGLKAEYFIFSDPFIILAAAILLDRMLDLRYAKWTYVVGVALMIVHGILSQAEPVKYATKRSAPTYICDWNQHYQPELPLPWCELPKKRG